MHTSSTDRFKAAQRSVNIASYHTLYNNLTPITSGGLSGSGNNGTINRYPSDFKSYNRSGINKVTKQVSIIISIR